MAARAKKRKKRPGSSRKKSALSHQSLQLLQQGVNHHQAGRLTEAEACYRQALQLSPGNPDLNGRLGLLNHQKGDHDEAARRFEQALKTDPKNPMLHGQLGIVERARKRYPASAACFRKALTLQPGVPEIHYDLALSLGKAEHPKEAENHFRKTLRLRPGFPKADNGLGDALLRQGRAEEAETSFRQAIALDPRHAIAHSNLGAALNIQERYADALPSLEEALRLQPDLPEAHYNLGICLQALKRLDDASASYVHAIQLRPDFAEAHKNLGLNQLLAGRYEQGWEEYEWRWKTPEFLGTKPNLPQPELQKGEEIAGRTLFIYAEQGLGDAIQMVRFLKPLADRGADIILRCQAPLKGLFEGLPGVKRIILPTDPLPDCDRHASLMGLPHLLGATLETVTVVPPYLSVERERVSVWEERILPREGREPRVGVAWAGNPSHTNDHNRSLPREALNRLLETPNALFHSLQVKHRREEWAGRPGDLTPWINDLRDTAAAIMNLDLVISVDSAVAHLAGALGRPVWTLIPHNPDWRWGVDRADSPWHPAMRLFRQPRAGAWQEVIDQVCAALENLSRA